MKNIRTQWQSALDAAANPSASVRASPSYSSPVVCPSVVALLLHTNQSTFISLPLTVVTPSPSLSLTHSLFLSLSALLHKSLQGQQQQQNAQLHLLLLLLLLLPSHSIISWGKALFALRWQPAQNVLKKMSHAGEISSQKSCNESSRCPLSSASGGGLV